MLLRAVWMRDHEIFARVFQWTEAHLRRADGLYSWRWRPGGGTEGQVLDPNTATDADEDVAFALVLASHAFGRPEYLERARSLVRAIRTVERLDLPGAWIPSAGNWAAQERIVNLSYFSPYAYPYFARVDPDGDWLSALRAGYDLVARTRQLPGARLIPDFFHVNPDGRIELLEGNGTMSSDFSFDAMRTFWRVALDCRLHQRMRACADPVDSNVLVTLLARDGAIFTRYRIDGTVVDRGESLSFYGAILPSLSDHSPQVANAIMAERLSGPVLRELLGRADRYYDANWVWFGLALHDGLILERTPAPEEIPITVEKQF